MTAQQMVMFRHLLDSLLSTATAIEQLMETVDEEEEAAAAAHEVIPQKRRAFLGDDN